MRYQAIDLDTWSRRDHFQFFRSFNRPHYAVTSRIDVTHMLAVRQARGFSPYRASLFGIACGINSVPELRSRFSGNDVRLYEAVDVSVTVPIEGGSFNYAYIPFAPDFETFDQTAAGAIEKAKHITEHNPDAGADDGVAYLSCLPWLDFTSINNAMPTAEDCIPRVSWGKFVAHPDGRHDMAMAIEVHHALVDGEHVAAFFEATQTALNGLS